MTTRTSLPLGWSGNTNNGSSGVVVSSSSTRLSQGAGDALSGDQSANFGDAGAGCAEGAECSGFMPNFGFWTECNSSTLPYDLPADSSTNITMNATLFTSAFTWTNENPNEINFRVQWKAENEDAHGPCKGDYKVQECRMRAASLKQPVIVTTTRPSLQSTYFPINLDSGHPWYTDTLDHILPVLPEEGVTNSTYGGFAAIMQKFFTGSVNISYVEGKPSVVSDGFYSSLVGIAKNLDVDSFIEPPVILNTCNLTARALTSIPFGDQIMNSIRQLVWTSVTKDHVAIATSTGGIPRTEFQTEQLNAENHYKIVWVYWVGSLIITLSIVVAVTPIFWGFWLLGRRTTMSPFETARVSKSAVIIWRTLLTFFRLSMHRLLVMHLLALKRLSCCVRLGHRGYTMGCSDRFR